MTRSPKTEELAYVEFRAQVRRWLTRLRREQAVTLSPTIQVYVHELESLLDRSLNATIAQRREGEPK